MAVTALNLLSLTVRDLESSVAFYCDAFGCTTISDDDGSASAFAALMKLPDSLVRRKRLKLGSQTLELVSFEPKGAPWPEHKASNNLTFQHIAIVVADMQAAHAHLARIRGWTPISTDGPAKLPPSSGGVTAFKFRDPEGHPLELLYFPDKAAPNGQLFYEINHSAIVVRDTARSIAFYAQGLGLTESGHSLNQGSAQAQLDALNAPVVQVTALEPRGEKTPHLELLCYQAPPEDTAVPPDKKASDAIATRLVFTVDDVAASAWRLVTLGGSLHGSNTQAAFLRDPDGHDLILAAL